MKDLASLPTFLALLLVLTLCAAAGCGKPADSTDYDGVTAVVGEAAFGNQCPYGSYSDPRPAKLTASACQGISKIEFSTPPQPLILQADCKKKSLTIRSADGRLDSLWETMPDGSFYITVETGQMRLKTNGLANSECTTYTASDIWGKLSCSDRDRATIQVETIWWPGKGKKPSSERATSGSECSLPSGCYFYASAAIQQCR